MPDAQRASGHTSTPEAFRRHKMEKELVLLLITNFIRNQPLITNKGPRGQREDEPCSLGMHLGTDVSNEKFYLGNNCHNSSAIENFLRQRLQNRIHSANTTPKLIFYLLHISVYSLYVFM